MPIVQEQSVTFMVEPPLYYNTMAREIESVHQFEHNPRYRLAKHLTVIRCDDGTVYQFEQAIDEPQPKLAKSHQPDGSLSHTSTKGRLPAAVKETANTLLGGWEK